MFVPNKLYCNGKYSLYVITLANAVLHYLQ